MITHVPVQHDGIAYPQFDCVVGVGMPGYLKSVNKYISVIMCGGSRLKSFLLKFVGLSKVLEISQRSFLMPI